jgi:hypothetical protein
MKHMQQQFNKERTDHDKNQARTAQHIAVRPNSELD